MHIAYICSNYYPMHEKTPNGTAIFNYSLLSEFAKLASADFQVTAYAAEGSTLPVPMRTPAGGPLSAEPALIASGKHILYEQELVRNAFMSPDFDLFHINIGSGDIVLTLAALTDKPILVTMHHLHDAEYERRLFSMHTDVRNLHFVSASDSQRSILPHAPYYATIHHGVDQRAFRFSETGGDTLMWAGRAIPEKGPDVVVRVARETGRPARLFGIPRAEHVQWLEENVQAPLASLPQSSLALGRSRSELIDEYQISKAFVLPVTAQEAFGLVFVEAMSCGTPIIAYASGSVPEIVEDGVTGFIVAKSADVPSGPWITKNVGPAGIAEAVERLYALPSDEYAHMRRACREAVETRFSMERVSRDYLAAYADLCSAPRNR